MLTTIHAKNVLSMDTSRGNTARKEVLAPFPPDQVGGPMEQFDRVEAAPRTAYG